MRVFRKAVVMLSIFTLVTGMFGMRTFAESNVIDGVTATATSSYTDTTATASTVYRRVAYKYVDVMGVYRRGNLILNSDVKSDTNGGISDVSATVTVSKYIVKGVYAHHTVKYGNVNWSVVTRHGIEPAK